jgi:hypothetical protein
VQEIFKSFELMEEEQREEEKEILKWQMKS